MTSIQDTMTLYFVNGYHGGTTLMDRWAEKGFYQGPIWEFRKTVPRWLRDHVFRRLDSFPNYKVVFEIEAVTFEYWRRHDPELLREIAERIERGQIEIADGTYSQPYGHVLGHESIVRQFLYGQEILERLVGCKSVTHFKQEHMFVPNMPGLLSAAGYTGVVLRAHINHFGRCPAIDDECILWRGADGKTIPAIPNYFEDLNPYGINDAVVRQCEALAEPRGLERMLLTKGLDVSHDADFIADFLKSGRDGKPFVCNEHLQHDGYLLSKWPTVGMSDEHLRMLYDRGYEPTLLSTFIAGYNTETVESQAFDADYFGYTCHWGVFGDAVMTAIKRAEASLYAADAVQALGALAGFENDEPDSAAMARAWKLVLEAQCHDVHLCQSAYSLAVCDFPFRMGVDWCRTAEHTAETLLSRHSRGLLRHTVKHSPAPRLCLFNPLSFDRHDPAAATIELPTGFGKGMRLFAGSEEVPFDCLRSRRYPDGSLCSADVILAAAVPGFGFQTIAIEPAPDLPEIAAVNSTAVDTGCINAEMTGRGTLAGLELAGADGNFLSGDPFEGNELTADFLDGTVRTGQGPGGLACHAGQYVTAFKTEGNIGDNQVWVSVRFYQGSPRIDFETRIDFDKDTSTLQSGLHMEADEAGAVRVHFNPSFQGDFHTDFPLSVERSTGRCVPGQSFGCLSNGERGVTLINRGNTGYYRGEPDATGLSLILASGDSDYHYGPYPLSGKLRFRYSLIAHRGDWISARAVGCAAEVNTPVRASMIQGDLAVDMKRSLLHISEPAVLATALMQHNGMTFLRLWNSLPEPADVALSCCFPLNNVSLTDIYGQRAQPVKRTKDSFELAFSPFELKTLVLNPK